MADRTIARTNPKAPLTAAEVAAIKSPTEGRLVVRDPGCRGLTLRITAGGIRTWSLEVKAEGRQRRFSVGDASKMTLADARKKASALRVSVLEQGVDPVADRKERLRQARQRRAGAADAGSLKTLLDSFERLKAKPGGLRSWSDMRQLIESNFKNVLDKSPDALAKADFMAVLDAAVARESPISGKRAVRYLSRVYSWAVERDLLPSNPAAGLNLDELTRPERVRQRVLSDDEIRAVWRAAIEAGPPFGDLARLYLLTGLRREEAAAMKQSDLDDDVLVMPATKSDQPHRLPLSAAAMAIVRSQPIRKPKPAAEGAAKQASYLFTLSNGSSVAGRATNWHRENARLVAAAGTGPWVWHDLRRTARTLLARIGVDDLVAELILNHALPGKLRRTYVLHRYQDEMRAALEKLAAFVEQIVAGNANVVNLRQAAG